MLAILSPAKRLDFERPLPPLPPVTRPRFPQETSRLVRTLRNLSQKKIRELMDLSEDLARLNAARYAELDVEAQDVRPALLAFQGDTYRGFDARTLDEDGFAWAQDHLRILSGLYGLLRPLDGIQPHRLEMGTRLKTRWGPDLYTFWGDRLARQLVEDVEASGGERVLVNLASQEYFRAVRRHLPSDLPVVTPVFLDTRDGRSRTLFLFAKLARGAMARHLVDRRATGVDDLLDFDWGGYRFRPELSEGDRLVFERPQPPPARRSRARA